MSEAATLPKGLRKEDVEKGMIGKVAELPYLPLIDEKAQAERSLKGNSIEVKMLNDTKKTLKICRPTANKEQFLVDTISYKDVLLELGLIESARKCTMRMEVLDQRMVKNFYDPDDPVTQVDPVKMAACDKAAEAHNLVELKLDKIIKKMFAMFVSFLDESLRPVYNEIVATKVGVIPWTNLRGEEQTVLLRYTMEAYEMCTVFWLRTVFQQDAAEQLLLYIQYNLKKSEKVSLRMFVARAKQLNSYVAHLPGIYYTSQANSKTVPAKKLTESELAGWVLRMCPSSWQTQHRLIKDEIPQDLERLLQFLELQESMDTMAKPTTNPRDQGHQNGGTNSKKRNGSENGNRDKKKFKSSKHCDYCAKKGGPKDTHNTAECRKWNPDGTRKQYQAKSEEKKTNVNYAQFKEMQDSVRDMSKDMKRLMKRSKEASDSDQDT